MPYAKGSRVKHPGRPDWGLGEVLENSSATAVRVFFVGAGERTLSLEHVTPDIVTGPEASNGLLDNLMLTPGVKGQKFISLPQAIEFFLEKFPEGFYGERYLAQERNYKVAAHDLALQLLAEHSFAEMLGANRFEEICKRALRVTSATNLIFPNEKMSLKDGLVDVCMKKQFSESLYQLLFGVSHFELRFKRFCATLKNLGAAKWTTATYFPFVVLPNEHIFLKPSITRAAAAITWFEINYRPELNWLTYRRVLEFADHLRRELSELKPRDMIDVQSFMWCIAPHD